MGLLSGDAQARDAKMSDLVEATGDEEFEGFQALAGDDEATPEEEAQLGVGVTKLMELISGDDSLPAIANAFHKDRRGLMEVIPDLLAPILLKIRDDIQQETGREASSALFFGQGGLMETGVDLMFDLAQQLEIPGSDDPDQYSGSLIGLYKKAGEHILQNNDGEAMNEAIDLGKDLVVEGEGVDNVEAAGKKISKRGLSGGIQKGLLS